MPMADDNDTDEEDSSERDESNDIIAVGLFNFIVDGDDNMQVPGPTWLLVWAKYILPVVLGALVAFGGVVG